MLELAELVIDGVLPRLGEPGQLPVLAPGLALAAEHGEVVLEDAEGTPVAVLGPGAELRAGRPFSHPPLRSARRTPASVRAGLGGDVTPGLGSDVTAVIVDAVPTAELGTALAGVDGPVLWLAVIGAGRTAVLPPEALLRAVRELAAQLGRPGAVLPVAVPDLPGLPDLLPDVAAGYGATRVLRLPAADGDRQVHPAFAAELDRARRPAHRRGVTVFLTGLSGSGKSTIARRFTERLLDDGRRTVTLLDGDEVRRLLSHGLGFSRADRDLNIRRIGFVATEVTRHGGVAVCAPIAPFAEVRAQVRADVEAVGDLLLVHVATPLAECERRDRKGLYAKARRGEIAEFTGISSPYQEPTDADLRIDTTGRSIDDCVEQLWRLFTSRGYLGTS